MKINFTKYHGTGNDFILIDNRKNQVSLSEVLIKNLCDRHFGIGADGLIILKKSEHYDFEMQYFNSDGKEGTMCGNGARCVIFFARQLGIIPNKTVFTAIDGLHEGQILNINKDEAIAKIRINDISKIEKIENAYFIDTGSPHYILFSDNIKNINIKKEGKKIRYSKQFHPYGTNVDFVEINNDQVFVRTYERGVEEETLSCGTGVVAVAAAIYLRNNKLIVYNINTLGGLLKVSFRPETNKRFTDVWLEGTSNKVFNGSIEI